MTINEQFQLEEIGWMQAKFLTMTNLKTDAKKLVVMVILKAIGKGKLLCPIYS